MALILEDEYPSNTDPADADYPGGRAKNESTPGAEDGLPGEKEWFNDFLGFFQGLWTRAGITPSGNKDTVLISDYHDSLDIIIALNIPAPNAVIDGGMLVGTGAVPSISAAYQYGQCPLIAAKADGTPTNGDIEQVETSLLGETGFACKLEAITTGGGGIIYYRYRIESKDSRRFTGKAALVHCKVYHSVGSSIDYTITVNKADAEDDFSSVTNIDTSGALPVDDTTATQISFVVSNMGTPADGIEIIISAACGSITTKSFYLSELTLQEGAVISPFENKPISEVENNISRYFERWENHPTINTPFQLGYVNAVNLCVFYLKMVKKRAKPTLTTSGNSTFEVVGGGITGTVTSISTIEYTNKHVSLSFQVSGTPWSVGDIAYVSMVDSVGAFVQFDARL